MRKILILNVGDNIGVCLSDLNPGDSISQDGRSIISKSRIPRGHKIAMKKIAKNDGVIKYGERIGHATSDIEIGEHVHTHNVLGDRLSAEQGM